MGLRPRTLCAHLDAKCHLEIRWANNVRVRRRIQTVFADARRGGADGRWIALARPVATLRQGVKIPRRATMGHKGSCFCGEVQFEVNGEPAAMGYCHC